MTEWQAEAPIQPGPPHDGSRLALSERMKIALRPTLLALAVTLSAVPAHAQKNAAASAAGVGTADPVVSVVAGTVALPAPDGQLVTVPGVTVTLTCGDAPARTEVSDGDGRFRFEDTLAAACSVAAELDGAKATQDIAVQAGRDIDVPLTLQMAALHQDVQVTASVEQVENAGGPREQKVDATTLETAPLASARFQDALPLIPGVIRGPTAC